MESQFMNPSYSWLSDSTAPYSLPQSYDSDPTWSIQSVRAIPYITKPRASSDGLTIERSHAASSTPPEGLIDIIKSENKTEASSPCAGEDAGQIIGKTLVRREQNRIAQRKFRERKAKYINYLENRLEELVQAYLQQKNEISQLNQKIRELILIIRLNKCQSGGVDTNLQFSDTALALDDSPTYHPRDGLISAPLDLEPFSPTHM